VKPAPYPIGLRTGKHGAIVTPADVSVATPPCHSRALPDRRLEPETTPPRPAQVW